MTNRGSTAFSTWVMPCSRQSRATSSAEDVAALCRAHGITHVLNAVDPRFVLPIFEGAFAAGADYLDLAMSSPRCCRIRPNSVIA